MTTSLSIRAALMLGVAAFAWWLYARPDPLHEAAPDPRPPPAATERAAPLAFPLAGQADAGEGGRTANGLFGLGRRGELIVDARTLDQLNALAQSLPRDLTEAELRAVDEFSAAGLDEPAAGRARSLVRAHLTAQGIGLAPPAAHTVATPVPEVMPESLLALRPPLPASDGTPVHFPGMGDENQP